MDNLKLCDHCPIEKSPDGLCYEGQFLEDGTFQGMWKCIYYNKELNQCDCPD